MSWRYRRTRSGFAPYVTKAEKLHMVEKARSALLKKKGGSIEPVIVTGREIARTWWGKAWNQNLERYADYDNRLPRGRAYVRNGAVLDLKIAANTITAQVAGSRAKPYEISIKIKPLDKKNESALMEKSRQALDSMQALLSGEFPVDLKESFLAEGTGLFPSPREISFSCSCPDWAAMCKHVASALYGTAVRLDEKPELFFVLRGVKTDDFVGRLIKRESAKMLKKAKVKSERVIEAQSGDISKLFGINMEEPKVSDKKSKPRTTVSRTGKTAKRTKSKPKKPAKPSKARRGASHAT